MGATTAPATFTYLVAEDRRTGQIVGTVTGVDHELAFGDPEGGTSLWCLAVDGQDAPPGTGEALVRVLAERYVGRGRAYLDLSVMHDNAAAIPLYRKLGFTRVAAVCVKRKNPINTPLFAARAAGAGGAQPLRADHRRGGAAPRIRVEVTDAESGELRLSVGGRTVPTRESLSEFTTAVAMSRCDDKRVTRRIMERAGVRVARGAQRRRGRLDEAAALLARVRRGRGQARPRRAGPRHHGRRPRRRGAGAGGRVRAQFCPDVLVEELVGGDDLRVVVIDHEVVAAAVRRPAEVVGDGRRTVAELIAATSRRRERATGGESRIPLDDTTAEVVAEAGYGMDDVPPNGAAHPGPADGEPAHRRHDRGRHRPAAPRDRRGRRAGRRGAGSRSPGWTSWCPTSRAPTTSSSRPTSGPGWPTTSRSRSSERFVDLLFPETRARR